MQTIYFDHAATTSVDPRVRDTIFPFLDDEYGNASSIHHMGRKSNVVVETWRDKIARAVGAETSEIIFTSGGTESNNAAIWGTLKHTSKKHIVTSKSEHNAVLFPVEQAAREGYEVTFVSLDKQGKLHPGELEKVVTDQTALVSLMHVNNETGILHPLSEMAEICRKHGAVFHSDAVQSIGKIPVNVQNLGVDLLSISAHKFHGPKGIGAMYVRAGTPWSAWMHGGAQERGRRGGTLNVPGIAGLGKALELAEEEMEYNSNHVKNLKNRFIKQLTEVFGKTIRFNGDVEHGIHHILSITLTDHLHRPLDGEMLLLNLDIEGICCSNGSACTSGTMNPSHVMMALGYDEKMAKSTLRFSLDRSNTEEEIDRTTAALAEIVARHSDTDSEL